MFISHLGALNSDVRRCPLYLCTPASLFTCKEIFSQCEPRRSTRINQSEQSLLEGTKLTYFSDKTDKKNAISNKDTEITINDTCVHSFCGKDAAVEALECGKRTNKTTDQPPAKRKSKISNVKNVNHW